jgi:hypothetical protein
VQARDLKRVMIETAQAVQVATLLGLTIKDEDV